MYLKQGYRLHNDKYQLLNVLGEGGFSLTYRGAWKTEVQGNLGKIPTMVPVCIKEYYFKDYCLRNQQTCFVETNNETGKEIFNKNKEKIIREARILAEINHPNVVNVLEVFKQNNTVYIVMEFISGRSLKHEVEKNGILTEEKLKKIIFKIGQALDYIHEKNILHLDIKPSNILMDNNNNPKLIDFGISKKYDLSNVQETSTALLAASKGYSSIEQYDSEGIQIFSPCPDIYSLGATMYFLITGQTPTESILRSTKGLQNPREINPAISENTEKVILKAMALNASDRYQSVKELLSDLGFDPVADRLDLTYQRLPEYQELASKMSDEPYDFDADDETVIRSNIADNNNEQIKNGWLFFIAPLIVSGLLAFILFGGFGKIITDEPVTDEKPVTAVEDSVITNVPKQEIVQIDTKKSDTSSNPVENKTSTPVDTIQEKYQKTYNEALNAFDKNDFNLALELIIQAEIYKKTDETQHYKVRIEQELEKKDIEKRKALYREIRKFGNFVVVKRISDGMVGVIDDKGNEKIEFKYRTTEPLGNNRLFQREDNKYDLYSPTLELIDEGLTGLE